MDNNGFNEYNPQPDPFSPAPQQHERPYYRARDFRAAARKALQGFWLMAIAITLVAGLLGGTSLSGIGGGSSVNYNIDTTELDSLPGADESAFVDYVHWLESVNNRFPALRTFVALASVLSTVQLVIGGPITLGYNRFKLHRLDGETAAFADLFSCFDRFLDGLWMRIRMLLQIIAWLLLFIIPGIVAAYRYSMVPYLMADHPDMTVAQAFERSTAMMRGHKGELFLLHLSFIGWLLLSAVTLGLAGLVISPYMQFAETAFYRNLAAGNV